MSVFCPIMLDLRHVRILVVGGGRVATRRVATLLEHGGRPDVIAAEATPELTELARRKMLDLRLRNYAHDDTRGYGLVVAATSSPALNAAIARDAAEARAWVSVVDGSAESTFEIPAIARDHQVVAAISTGGAAPLLARRLRDRIGSLITPGLGRTADRLAPLRARVRERWPRDEARRRAFWHALITEDFLDAAIAGRDEEIENSIVVCLSQS